MIFESKAALPAGLYGILGEEFSKGRKNADVARMMIAGGIGVIQYREKENRTKLEKYRECLEIGRMAREGGALFIVNDDIDIALAAGAGGVHIGQDDLPLAEARRLVGAKIIGVSTHSPGQALAAIAGGADYIGVGPVFRTFTKKDVCDPVGLDYVRWAAANATIPWVAIGGIKEGNLDDVLAAGAKTVAMVTEVLGADGITALVKRINGRIAQALESVD